MHPLLVTFRPIVKFLGLVLGEDSEVVLHDVTDVDKSIIDIANQHISGRKMGAPATDLALKVLKNGKYHDEDYLVNYKGKSASGKVLHSSTFFIRDEERNIIGMLCLNVDRNRFKEISDLLKPYLCSDEELDDSQPTELFSRTVEDLSFDSVDKEIEAFGIPVERLNYEEKKDIVRRLYEDGVFMLKGSIPFVATRLHVSDATLYRYLNTIKGE